MKRRIRFFRQRYSYDCGSACLRMICAYYGKYLPEWVLYSKVPCTSTGWNITDFCNAAKIFGLATNAYELQDIAVLRGIQLPVTLQYNNHYIVLFRKKGNKFVIADPLKGKIILDEKELQNEICHHSTNTVLISFELTPSFKQKVSKKKSYIQIYDFFDTFFTPYKNHILKIIPVLILVTIAQLIIPFISKSVIDIGLETASWNFIKLLLIANIVLVFATILGRLTQNYLITHITNRIKIGMLDNFIEKLFNMPYAFFQKTNIGDVLQRIKDNERIQNYFVAYFFTTGISILLIIAFSLVLLYFHTILFLLFLLGSIIYVVWVWLFLSQRKKLDLNIYELLATNNKQIIQIHNAITDIKYFNVKQIFKNNWRNNLIDQHDANISLLKLTLLQDSGAGIINQIKNLSLTYLCCYYVLKGEMSLGVLFSIQYIIGNMNAPLTLIISFMNQSQTAFISLSRVFEFNNYPDEVSSIMQNNKFIPIHKDISLNNISFRFPDGTIAIKGISLKINQGKKIGIVGSSGCGKSTLLKIIAGILIPTNGEYLMGTSNVTGLSPNLLKKEFSFVLQDSLLFDGSIIENITGSNHNSYDEDKLIKTVEACIIRKEIEGFNEGYQTNIEGDNKKLSKGQYQRMLLARSLYKESSIYIFDEATSSLNPKMEERIFSNIDKLLENKTRIIATHRIDPIKNADLIFVLRDGFLVEVGTHKEMIDNKRDYYNLFNTKTNNKEQAVLV